MRQGQILDGTLISSRMHSQRESCEATALDC